ncbi:translation initiation factor IF-2 [Impatiens glandulifera]|uniref:translation initiation factor IF-2 n=1 Tax=Impatiens glandulifera TaxID=253017 RepID=UPI001FB083E8|nr:translation initiation factor IF-2 [Impatiens glandulifera]
MRPSLGKISSASASLSNGTIRCLISPFSTSSSGRGSGRGSPSPTNPFTVSNDDLKAEEIPLQAGIGHGRGIRPPPTPSFASDAPNRGIGRGRGFVPLHPSQPIPPPSVQSTNEPSGPPKRLTFAFNDDSRLPITGAGRGRPVLPVAPEEEKPKQEENRHLRQRQRQASEGSRPVVSSPIRSAAPNSREDAAKRAGEILSSGGGGGRGEGRGRGGGRGRGARGRGRGRNDWARGRRNNDGKGQDEDDNFGSGLHLGDDADGEKMAQKFGPDFMGKLEEAFDEMSNTVLPSPMQDAYLEALDTNYSIECEPEYLMEDFGTNPDIDETPPISLQEALEKMKPFLMAYEGIKDQAEWEEIVAETMKNVPLMKEIVDHYSGPDRVTAKKQNEELERVAKTLPQSAHASVKRFTDRAVLSLQSNPSWGFDKKCQFMDKLVWEVSQQYK